MQKHLTSLREGTSDVGKVHWSEGIQKGHLADIVAHVYGRRLLAATMGVVCDELSPVGMVL